MHAKDELAVRRREEQVLASTSCSLQAAFRERGERRIERLQRRDVRRSRFLDRQRARRAGRAPGPTPRFRAALATTTLLHVADPLSVVVTRGAVVEARHRVHAVAVRDGRIVASAGDAHLLTFLRSSAKPIQALPLVRARPDLGDREIAIACASHLARPDQLDAVRALLAAAPAREDELETGPDPSPIEHNCSGKHAGFLALCRSRGWESAQLPAGGPSRAAPDARRGGCSGGGDRGLDRHRHRRLRRRDVRAAARPLRPSSSVGCRRSTAGLASSRRCAPSRSCCAGPSLPTRCSCGLSTAGSQRVAPRGCSALPRPTVSGLRSRSRTAPSAPSVPPLAAFLGGLGIDPGEFGVVAIENSRGEVVGEVREES